MKALRTAASYLATAYAELLKVVWPSRRDVFRHTFIIAVSVTLAIAVLGLLDYGLTALLKVIIVTP